MAKAPGRESEWTVVTGLDMAWSKRASLKASPAIANKPAAYGYAQTPDGRQRQSIAMDGTGCMPWCQHIISYHTICQHHTRRTAPQPQETPCPTIWSSSIPPTPPGWPCPPGGVGDRKSTRLNSSHLVISYAVFCLKKKKKEERDSHHIPHHTPKY